MRQNKIIGIGGVSGAGKTAVTIALSERLNNALAIFWDDYDMLTKAPGDYVAWYKNGKNYVEWDARDLADTLKKLKRNETFTCPAIKKMLKPTPIIVFDAPLGYKHEQTGKYIDCFVFLDTPPDVALARRILRDCCNSETSAEKKFERIKANLEHYLNLSRDVYLDAYHLKDVCDLSVDGTKSIDEVVDLIVQKWELL